MSLSQKKFYSLGEEIANSITHGVGIGLSLAGSLVLVILSALRGGACQIFSSGVYGGALLSVYMTSTLYHSFQRPHIKHVFRILDHAAIYLLIAGTYTPFLILGVRGTWAWVLLGIIWGVALLGVGLKVAFFGRFPRFFLLTYVLLGWSGALTFQEALRVLPSVSLICLALGGLSYTAGVLFYIWRRLPYNHAIWHLFVLGGSACHYVSIFNLLPQA
jgi:hemolysin III